MTAWICGKSGAILQISKDARLQALWDILDNNWGGGVPPPQPPADPIPVDDDDDDDCKPPLLAIEDGLVDDGYSAPRQDPPAEDISTPTPSPSACGQGSLTNAEQVKARIDLIRRKCHSNSCNQPGVNEPSPNYCNERPPPIKQQRL